VIEMKFTCKVGCDYMTGRLFLVETDANVFNPSVESYIVQECARKLDIPVEEIKYRKIQFGLEVKDVSLSES